ncbi:hypothetical protein [Spiroplasma melliferum]|uniref:Uncharacterized protein n=3 Tax=Spiroplasma melliferum TaxID=2134 RepID=A0AAI9T445_SPIME|nr:hypothetical protein [Spiroplasma melliferum]KAI93118.1 hypothetical protein SPM_000805 [Spiroplasma melliferum KC3]QCO24234.1 hypothetical protein SRED_002722 [Spiroplasma melliferum]
MKKIIDSIEQVISFCGQDFAKWPNNMAPDVLKATYEMLKEYQERLNHHEVDEIFSESDREQILEKVKSFYENKLDEKDNHITFLENTISSEIVLRDELIEKLKQNQLKKSDFVYIQGKSLIIGTEGAYVIKSEFKEKIESLED